MPSLSQVNVCNLALLSIGSRSQISSLTENSTQSNACAQFYPFVFNSMARAANWNCLRKQAKLSLLAAAEGTPENPSGTGLPVPSQPWLYAYAYPSDCLRLRFLLPTFNTGQSGSVPQSTVGNAAPFSYSYRNQIPFAVAYSTDATGNPIIQILTNLCQAQAVYTVDQPNPVIWDSQFQQAMVAALAAYLVPALSLNLPLMNRAVAMAEKIIMQARVSDGDETFVTQNREADWIVARGGFGFFGQASGIRDFSGNSGGGGTAGYWDSGALWDSGSSWDNPVWPG